MKEEVFTLIISILLYIIFLCRGDLIAAENSTSSNISSTPTIEKISTAIFDLGAFPQDCSQRQKRNTLFKHKNSRLRKCCPIGESLIMNENIENGAFCGSANMQLIPNLINVTLYDNCVEDMETEFTLPIEIGNPCNTSILYNDKDDKFFIIQDGSLLVMDLYANDTYALYNNYCVDINNISGISYAIVCLTSVEEYIGRSQIVFVAILMLISIPCLLCVFYLHVRIKELRSLHGIILSCMSACLATGNLLYSLVHIFHFNERNTGYAVQFFILSYYFWFFSLCCNVAINVWIHILLNKTKTKPALWLYFSVYCLTSLVGSVTLVTLTLEKGLPGMPSYFMQGYTESIRESQRYFIPPVSILLLLSFLLLTATLFGFQKLNKQGVNLSPNEESISSCYNEEVRKDAKCISFLGLILLTTWLLEIVTFYSPGPQIYLILMDMINGLQGVFVLLIFLVMRKRRTIIFNWWNDRGSYSVEKTEIDLLNASI